jgi:hypothetical protein
LFTAHVGSGSSLPPVEFSSLCHFYKLSHSWLLGVCRLSCLLQPACLFTVPRGISPPFGAQGTPPSLLHVFIVIAYYSVSLFFPLGWGRSVQGAMLIWPRVVCGVPCTAYLTLWSTSSQAVWSPASGGSPGALLVSPFNGKWRYSAQAGGVEGVKVLPLLSVFFCKVYIQCFSKISL